MIHESNEYGHTLWIRDYHTEYPVPGAHIIFNPHELEDLFGEETVTILETKLPQELTDGTSIYIWQMYGKIDELNKHFKKFCKEVMQGPQGADDDTFDYWPSAFDVCWQIAQDLDKLTTSITATDYMKNMWKKADLDVPEFEPDWEVASGA